MILIIKSFHWLMLASVEEEEGGRRRQECFYVAVGGGGTIHPQQGINYGVRAGSFKL